MDANPASTPMREIRDLFYRSEGKTLYKLAVTEENGFEYIKDSGECVFFFYLSVSNPNLRTR